MVNLITSYKKFWEPISWSRSFCAYSSFCGPKSSDWRPLCFSFVHRFPQSTNTTKPAHFRAVLQGDHHRFQRRFFVNTFIFSLNGVRLYSSIVQRDEFLWYTYPFTHSDQSPVSILPPFPVFIWNHLSPSSPWAVRRQDSHLWVLEHAFFSKQSDPPKKHGTKLENPCILLTVSVSGCPYAFFGYSPAVLTIPIHLLAYRLVNAIAWDSCT